jgi:hypothetical protein
MDRRCVYVVRSVRPRGNISYNCPTAEWALRKLRDFSARGDSAVTVLAPDGTPLSEADLVGCVEGSGAAPADEVLLAAPQITRQPVLA